MSRPDMDRLREAFEHHGNSPLSHPDLFKMRLGIGADAYGSLRRMDQLRKLWGPVGTAATVATVAKSPIVANTFFPASGILGLLGISTAATPIGWIIATSALSGVAWAGIATRLKKHRSARVTEIPSWIETPLDLLAFSIFDLIGSLAVKLAAVDGEIHERERAEIVRYFVSKWGYDQEFAKVVVDMMSESEDSFEDLARDLVEYTRSNRDCNPETISKHVLGLLHDVAEAVNGIEEIESKALSDLEKAFKSIS